MENLARKAPSRPLMLTIHILGLVSETAEIRRAMIQGGGQLDVRREEAWWSGSVCRIDVGRNCVGKEVLEGVSDETLSSVPVD